MKTLYDKLWEEHHVTQLDSGESLLYIDRHYLHEVTSPQAFEGLIKKNLKPWRLEANIATPDHNVPTTRGDDFDSEKIKDEISITPGYEFNKKNSITAKSGKYKYNFDISQQGFAWIADAKIEKKMIKTMKRGSRIMISGHNSSGSQTIDHYSLLGFTKAYNEAKKSCS